MAVDRNLFLYDLAVVAIMKNEEPYVEEWLNYHLLAGVEHFYIYDHNSTPQFKKILQPYIDAGIVTCIFFPDENLSYEAYNDAVQNYRFFCRYIAFIDGDEFILPKSRPTVPEVLDEILSDKPSAAALSAHWQCFGSNGLEQADLSRGVLDRFTRRAPSDWHIINHDKTPTEYIGNLYVKSIYNPRKVNYFDDPHNAKYFQQFHSVDEAGNAMTISIRLPIVAEKIVVNHYILKSREEFVKRKQKTQDAVYGRMDMYVGEYFQNHDRNEVFDDSILKYREARQNLLVPDGANFVEVFAEKNKIDPNKVFNALLQNLVPTFAKKVSPEILSDKPETFLTCRAVAAYLKENLFDETAGKFFESAALSALHKVLSSTTLSLADVQLICRELPRILSTDSPHAQEILQDLQNILPQIKKIYRENNLWKDYVEADYLLEMIKIFLRR